MSILLPLSRGLFTRIDEADLNILGHWSWRAKPAVSTGGGSQGFYACRTLATGPRKDRSTIYLHRVIMGAEPGQIVDHINGDKLDNRRSNLRFVSASENVVNRTVFNPTGYRGVTMTPSGKYRATITVRRNRLNIGRFDTAIDAARAYDAAAREHFGDVALTNFQEAGS